MIQFKKRNELKLEIKWLRDILQIGDKYPQIGDFKKCVVNPALKDINSSSNVHVELTGQIKEGRDITHLIFKYSISGLNDTSKLPIITNKYIEKHANIGESYQQARERLSKIKEGLK